MIKPELEITAPPDEPVIITHTLHGSIEARDGHLSGGRMEAGMTDGYSRLDDLPVAVGIVGSGQMGSGMVQVTHQMTGLRIRALADIDAGPALRTLDALGVPCDMICTTEAA